MVDNTIMNAAIRAARTIPTFETAPAPPSEDAATINAEIRRAAGRSVEATKHEESQA